MTFDPFTRSRLVGVFVDEARETVAALESAADRLRHETPADALADFGRYAHGLKGAAASLGFEDLAAALHALEALSLGLDDPRSERRSERYQRLRQALELLSDGVAEMSVSSRDAFPPAVSAALGELLRPSAATSPSPLPAAAGSRPAPDAVVERLSVPAADVDDVLRVAASVARGAAALEGRLAGAAEGPSAQALSGAARHLESSIAALRLVPAATALAGLAAEVEHLAGRLGKRARLETTGREVRADRRMLQAVRGLVRHLVRNAIDHGIEAPEERARAGKPPEGRLALSLEAADSALRVALADDGAGFDLAAVRGELARRSGEPQRVAASTDAEVLRRFAMVGGSTRQRATDISGRGLGLSAVAAAAAAAGGSIDIATVPGSGSTVTFTLPLEVYAVEVLEVAAGGRLIGVPLTAVERTVCLAASPEALQAGPAGRTLAVGETIVPFASLAAALGAAPGPERFAVVMRTAEGTMALGVEELANVAGVVPAKVPGLAQPDAFVTGLARLGDGSVLQVVEPRRLAAAARSASGGAVPRPSAAPRLSEPERHPEPLDVVLAEDSPATREVLRVLLEQQGFRVRSAADGEEALACIRERLPDVLVADVAMPRRDGLALTRAVRAGVGTARLPVILLTSRDDAGTRAAGAAAGADAYLIKSRFDAGTLHETLARLGVRKPR